MEKITTTPEVLLHFRGDVIEDCIDVAKHNHVADNWADMHFCHTPIGTLCVVLHRADSGLGVQVFTEQQGIDYRDKLRSLGLIHKLYPCDNR